MSVYLALSELSAEGHVYMVVWSGEIISQKRQHVKGDL